MWCVSFVVCGLLRRDEVVELSGCRLLSAVCSVAQAVSRDENIRHMAIHAYCPMSCFATAHVLLLSARTQEAALLHALQFPALQRLVYSTCSIHQRENEDVVAAVLPAAAAAGFRLVDPFPAWHRRGLPGVVEGAEKLVRTDAQQDGTDGFFVAVFERSSSSSVEQQPDSAGTEQPPQAEPSSQQPKQQQQQAKKKKKMLKHAS